jgi:squalene-hopene/tetraprenyl-beta-curcumene cyclase
MRSTHAWLTLLIALIGLAWPTCGSGQTPSAPAEPADNPFPYAAAEPKAKAFSMSKSAGYLDGVARFWMRPNSCGACHANFPYLMARPLLGAPPTSLVTETRQFLEQRKATPNAFSFDAEAVAIAFALAWDDTRAGGKLQAATRQALRRIWPLQHEHGGWNRMGCGIILPAENDAHYTAVLALLAVGVAPEGYAHSAEPRDGLTRLRRYFMRRPPRNLHDRAMLLWASRYVDGLMTTAERRETVQSLLDAHRPDGGWNLGVLSGKPRHFEAGPHSDGYGTALAIYVLRQAGVPATRPEIARGVAWLKSNQRASGRWFTPSASAGHPTEGGVGARDLYVQNLGTAFAVLALKACEGTDNIFEPGRPSPLRRMPGLSLRERLILD